MATYCLSSSNKPASLWISHWAQVWHFLWAFRMCVHSICLSSLGGLSKKALSVCTSVGRVWGSLSSSFLPFTGIGQLSSFCLSKGVKCYLVLICISWTTNEFEPHFMCLLAFGVSVSRKLPVISFARFSIGPDALFLVPHRVPCTF